MPQSQSSSKKGSKAKQSFVQTPFGMAGKSEKKKTTALVGKVIVQILPALNHGGVERGTIEMKLNPSSDQAAVLL